MQRQAKVELFEQLRRDYEFGNCSIRSLAKQYGVHRRLVRQALQNAVPPPRKKPARARPRIALVSDFIDAILTADEHAPRKQRHTAHRIYARLRQERPEHPLAESTVRQYVRERRAELGLLQARSEIFVPQQYQPGVEAQIDWYEAVVELDDGPRVAQVFSMRSMWSGAAFHRAYPRATQQAFLEAHEYGFRYFDGVFRQLRYDNLKSAVKKILRGHRREETERFIAFRSHWRFAAEFCQPARGNEKGGVESEVGYFRRNHFVPVPRVSDFAELNERLVEGCRADEARAVGLRREKVGTLAVREREALLPLPEEDFELAEESFCRVDHQGCVMARTNWYSTPLRSGARVRVRVLPASIEVWSGGRCMARHERCYGRRQQVLDLEHYLDVLEKKPGAFAGSKPLAQWRAEGRWTPEYEQLWEELKRRHGPPEGTRQMIGLLQVGRACGYERLSAAITKALKLGAKDAAAVRYLLNADQLAASASSVPPLTAPADFRQLPHYVRPLPSMTAYDQLLGQLWTAEVSG